MTNMMNHSDSRQGHSDSEFNQPLKATDPRSQMDARQFQVLGANLQIVIDGFGTFSLLASKLLLEEGLGVMDRNGMLKFEPGGWYPLNRWLNALERIKKEFGELLLFQSGQTTPRNAVFPPTVTDIHSALKCIDVAYHMNHAAYGEPMFNPGTGAMSEGIGHYVYSHVAGNKQISIESSTPYPCDFDRGIVIAMAQRFQPTAALTHDTRRCRQHGNATCVYHITWK
jgi:hypothetical protein